MRDPSALVARVSALRAELRLRDAGFMAGEHAPPGPWAEGMEIAEAERERETDRLRARIGELEWMLGQDRPPPPLQAPADHGPRST